MAFVFRVGLTLSEQQQQQRRRRQQSSSSRAVVTSILIVLSSGLASSSEEIVGGNSDWAGTWCQPPLPVIANSNLSATLTPTIDYSPPGTRLSIACDAGYRIEPSDGIVECQAGRWTSISTSTMTDGMAIDRVSSRQMPQCQVWCKRPTVPHGDILNSDSEYPPGTRVDLRCDEGYRLANKYVSSLQCGSDDGKWTGHNGDFTRESPECVLATCPPLPITPNAILEYRGTTGWDGGFRDGSRVSYACRQGYRMTFDDGGPTDREFECHDGVWQNVVRVTCELVGCGPPLSILDGEAVIDQASGFDVSSEVGALFPVGMRISYRCNRGFLLIGSTRRYRCSAKGHWVPTRLPTCRHLENDQFEGQPAQNCPAPPTVSHARLENATTHGPYPPNTAVSYVCDDGFFLEGLPNLICDQTGQWQPRPGPICRPRIILPEDCLKPEPASKMNEMSRNIVAEGRQMVPLLVGTLVSIVLLTVLLVVRYLSGWKSAGLPVCRSARQGSDDLIGRGGGCGGTNLDSDQRRGRSTSSLLYRELDRVALLNGTIGQTRVLPPTYEEAIQENSCGAAGGNDDPLQPLDVMYGCVLLPSNTNRHRCYRFNNLRNGFGAPPAACSDGLNPSFRHSAVSHSGCGGGRSSSLADSLNSTDTVTPSEVSTTVTVDTLSSNASSHPTSSISTRAFCGSLASFDTAESDSALNMEGVPLLEETEIEQGISPSSETRTVLET